MPSKASDKIHFHYLVSSVGLRKRTTLKEFIVSILKREGKRPDQINYIFCDDAYLLKLNQEYLNHDTLTDIITFEYSGKSDPVLSDIYISIERVSANAVQFKTSFKAELHRVMFHGVLHLCGYKDKTPEQSAVMRNKEQQYLDSYFKLK